MSIPAPVDKNEAQTSMPAAEERNGAKTRIPRLMLTAGASGSGKTLITCGILQALLRRGLHPVSFKCGPDFIDPLFHKTVLGTPSRNLDTFFTDGKTTRYLLSRGARGADVSVIEGVMGYYDGLGGLSEKASAYDVAAVTKTPAVLIVNTRGMSLSVIPYIQGFVRYRERSGLKGVILNNLFPMLYPQLKQRIESETTVRVYGYVERQNALTLESRHLGLVLPEEVPQLRQRLDLFADRLEQTLDLDGLLALAAEAPDLPEEPVPALPFVEGRPRIAVARDEAFCFLYTENLELLELIGAEPVFFSPLRDTALPEADGLLLPGGYPELHAERLYENHAMRESIREAVGSGLPTLAECGGFLYLQEEMEDMDGVFRPMAGVLPGRAFKREKLGRFGYITLKPQRASLLGQPGTPCRLKGHEFHYFDCTRNGDAFLAEKPLRATGWNCIEGNDTLAAGFPHLYYWSDPEAAASFVRACAKRKERRSDE